MWPKARRSPTKRWSRTASLLGKARKIGGGLKSGLGEGLSAGLRRSKRKRRFRRELESPADVQVVSLNRHAHPPGDTPSGSLGTLPTPMESPSPALRHAAASQEPLAQVRGKGVTRSTWAVGPDEDSPSKGLEANVIEMGVGTPVVFLHGLVGLNEHWEGVVDRTRDHCRCILFELPLLSLRGDDCSIQGVTRLTARFLQEYLDEPAVVVGNSFGGHVALRLALESPELVKGLVLAGSSGLIEKSMVSDIQIRPSKEWLRRKIGELFYDQSLMREADLERAHRELTDRGGARAMVKLSRSARRDHLGDRISEILVPTLLLWGRQDIVTPPEAAEGFKRMIKQSELVWFENCGHAPMIERPDGFAQKLTQFVANLPRR
mgnify:CR=1 FL=1